MTRGNLRLRIGLLGGLFIVLFILSLLVGRYPSAGLLLPGDLFRDQLSLRVFLRLRLPRVLSASLLGAALAASGCTFQMLFRNPLVEPGFLGISQGAAFGAAAAILFLPDFPGGVQLAALVFGLLGLSLSYAMARRIRFGGWIIRMVISGLAVSALFASGLGILKYLADPLSQLQEMTFWMLGGLTGITWSRTVPMVILAVPSLLLLLLFRWRMNLLCLDDLTAFSLGTNPARERLLLLVAASAATAAVSAAAGIVGWVGLLVPHAARRLVGPEGSRVIPVSLLLGGIMTLICDDIARALLSYEIPLGILTSFFGAALFLLMLSSGAVRFRR